MSSPMQTSGLLIGDNGEAMQGYCYQGLLRLSPGFDNSRIFFVAKSVSPARLVSKPTVLSLNWVRQRFLASIRAVTPDAGALVAGLSIGDDTSLSEQLASDFNVLSLTHLTAVSGTNCAIVLGLVWFLLGRAKFGRFVLTRWPRLFAAVLALFAYVALVGPQPSVLRAGVMTTAVLLSRTFGRGSGSNFEGVQGARQNASALNALGLSIALLIAFDPWMVFDYGFWLSGLACIGILVVAPAIAAFAKSRWPGLPSVLVLALAASLSAQVLCFAVLLQVQPGFATYSVLANLLAEPLVFPVTVLGILAVMASVVSAPLAGFISFVASMFAWPITLIASRLAGLPAAVGFWPGGFLGVSLAALLALAVIALALGAKRWRAASAFAVSLVLVIVLGLGVTAQVSAGRWGSGNWFVASCDVGQGDATVIRSQGQIALIDVGREPSMVDACLKQLHINHINLLQLTHFDLDHVGGLAGAMAGRQIDLAMLTPFVDTRPGAAAVRQAFEVAAVPVTYAETGLSGRLGDFSWQVLSPHAGAAEAEDSNDGSITMLWRSAKVDIITLADLGEKGQMRLASESGNWLDAQLRAVPLVMKVSHHGSADQYAELIEALAPALALVSVGSGNSYGHPTKRTLDLLTSTGAAIARTDLRGSVSVALEPQGFRLGFQGEQGKTG